MVPKPRLCTLVKQTTYDEYGFNLHAERGRGHYIGIVDEDSVGDYAGLQAGQRLVGVNGHLIYPTTTHREVLELIKADPLRVELLLASEDIDRWHAENQIPYSYENHIIFRHATQQHNGGNHQDGDVHTKSTIQSTTMGEQKSNILSQHRSNEVLLNNHHSNHPSANAPLPTINNNSSKEDHQMKVLALRINGASNNRHQPPPMALITDYAQIPRPRLCVLAKMNAVEEYGFNLHAERGKGHYIGSVDRDGIADRAGLETGQRIVGVNGQLIYPSTAHKEVVALIKRDPLSTELLVASEEVDRWYAEHRLPYSYETLERAPVRVPPTTISNNGGSHLSSSSGKQSPASVGASLRSSAHPQHPQQLSSGHMGNQQSRTQNSHSSYSGGSMSSSSSSSPTTSHPDTEKCKLPPKSGHEPPTTNHVGNGAFRQTAVPISIEVNRSRSNSAVNSIKGSRDGRPLLGEPSCGVNAKELLEQALKGVKPPPPPPPPSSSGVNPIIPDHSRVGELSRAKELDYQKHVIVSTPSPPTSEPTSRSMEMSPPLRGVATRYMADRPISHFSARGSTAGHDIFKMKPRDVQQMLVKRRPDPRLGSSMSFEEKHSVIDNL